MLKKNTYALSTTVYFCVCFVNAYAQLFVVVLEEIITKERFKPSTESNVTGHPALSFVFLMIKPHLTTVNIGG